MGPGEAVTLSWKVSNATSIELREATAGELPVAVDVFEGSLVVNPEVSSLYVLTAQGPTGTDARAVAVTGSQAAPAPAAAQGHAPRATASGRSGGA